MIFTTHSFDEIGSTNDEALGRARAGAAEGTTIIAKTQTAGRGRQNRQWQSKTGNLYTSILLRPSVPLQRRGELSFVAALAVGSTIGHFVGDIWKLKWPNDVLIRSRKIAGLLLEGETDWIILGIGINLAHAPELPDKPTTSLIAEGPSITPEQALHVLQSQLDHYYNLWQKEGFAPIRAAWLAHAEGLQKPIRARLADGRDEKGLFEGLDEDGALLLRRSDDGQLCRILAGDVFFS